MNDLLTAEIERIRSNPSIQSLDEANVKQGVILPVLNALGWNPFNTSEVRPEFPVQGGNVDYSLRLYGTNKVFLEAKRPSEDLSKHQVQLLNYSFADGVPLAILTNGLDWWFYLPLRVGSWEERRFCSIDLREGNVSQKVLQLTHYLSKNRISSGEAIVSAEMHLDILLGFRKAERALPKAWERLITDPEEIVIHLLNKHVKELCGNEADPDTIKLFLSGLIVSPSAPTITRAVPIIKEHRDPKQAYRATGDYINQQIASFTFNGQTFVVHKWLELLTTLAEQIYRLHPSEFHKVLELRGKPKRDGSVRTYFGRSRQGMNVPKPVGDSGYYVETKFDANNIVRRCHDLLAKFGYSPDALQIETA